MNSGEPGAEVSRCGPAPSAAVCAQAAAWIARLHGQERSARLEAGFRRWLAESAEHRVAFDLANEIWLTAERLPRPSWTAPITGVGLRRSFHWRIATAAVALMILFAGAFVHWRKPSLATAVGEQRTLSFPDGSRVSLNTASRVYVRFGEAERSVELEQGEAYFDVARHPGWPFVVVAGGRRITALGTAFLVRRDAQRVAVTLVEGRVSVEPLSEGVALQLAPGQRVTYAQHDAPRLDHPVLDKLTAWQRGQVIFDHTSLADAVAEMNRYSPVQLKIETPQAAQAPVTGIFRVGDSVSFAQAMTEVYGLRPQIEARRITLLGAPRSPGDTG